jgi:hypothetical protein
VSPSELANAVNAHLVRPNTEFLRRYPQIRFLDFALGGRIVYGRDPDECWLTIPHCIAHRVIDCEDAAGWLAAEDRVRRALRSTSAVYRSRGGPYHVIDARPGPAEVGEISIGHSSGYTLIDAARIIGMGRRGS